jgi:hypothetical protein
VSEIPEDIDAIATDIVRKPCDPDGDPDYEMYERIARALMAERERVAGIAARMVRFAFDYPAAIRSPK